jgi:hypothetical protein
MQVAQNQIWHFIYSIQQYVQRFVLVTDDRHSSCVTVLNNADDTSSWQLLPEHVTGVPDVNNTMHWRSVTPNS